MILSANEARRLTKTRWQAELTKVDKLIRKAISGNVYKVIYVGSLCPATVDYLIDQGYVISIIDNNTLEISWEDKEEQK